MARVLLSLRRVCFDARLVWGGMLGLLVTVFVGFLDQSCQIWLQLNGEVILSAFLEEAVILQVFDIEPLFRIFVQHTHQYVP